MSEELIDQVLTLFLPSGVHDVFSQCKVQKFLLEVCGLSERYFEGDDRRSLP